MVRYRTLRCHFCVRLFNYEDGTATESKYKRGKMQKNNIILSLKNIILFLKILTGHFTGKIKIIILCSTILMLNFINITNTSALSYESEIGIGFTFNPTLSINISSSDLVISNLVPGSSSDSNIINVSVLTNASHGYTLAVDTSSEDLVHSNNIDTFSSIATNANLSSLTADNTWGYSYKLSSNNTWSNYNGLPLHTNTSTTIINTDNQVSKPIDFKIGARAGSTQASGIYTNTITFTAVSKVAPMSLLDSFIASGAEQLNGYFKMQDMTHDICNNVDIEESELQLIDIRDNKIYWVAKLKDGNCWMTQNLDLAGGTEITSELSDVPENYTLPVANGFQEGNKLPNSSQIGFSDNTLAYVYNTGNHTDNCTSPGCYSYYSWIAVTAGSGTNITASNADAPYSICPKNWALAKVNNLVSFYGSGANFYNNAGPGTTPNLLISKCYVNNSFCSRSYGNYWNPNSLYNDTLRAAHTYFGSSNIGSEGVDRRYGLSARCIAK